MSVAIHQNSWVNQITDWKMTQMENDNNYIFLEPSNKIYLTFNALCQEKGQTYLNLSMYNNQSWSMFDFLLENRRQRVNNNKWINDLFCTQNYIAKPFKSGFDDLLELVSLESRCYRISISSSFSYCIFVLLQ